MQGKAHLAKLHSNTLEKQSKNKNTPRHLSFNLWKDKKGDLYPQTVSWARVRGTVSKAVLIIYFFNTYPLSRMDLWV